MTTQHRTFTILGLGLVLLGAPMQSSLEKYIPRPRAMVHTAESSTRVIASRVKKRVDSTIKAQMIASWYGEQFQGRQTSSGELFDLNKLTAAHKTLPLGCMVKLKAVSTGKSVVVRINDRGPWIKGRDFDLSEAAALALGIHNRGVAAVEATIAERDYAVMAKAQAQ